jgi:hypothetical protein
MRQLMIAAAMLVATAALAEKPAGKSEAAATAAKAVIDAADAAFNAGDVNAMAALLDKSFFGAGAYVSAQWPDPASLKTALEKVFDRGGGRLTRDALTLHALEDGDAVWYIAEYTHVPKVPPGVMPIHRKIRESGTLLRRGREYKFVMIHTSNVAADPPPPAAAK